MNKSQPQGKPRFEAWFEGVKATSRSPTRDKPVWTRQKASPALHARLQRARSFYDGTVGPSPEGPSAPEKAVARRAVSSLALAPSFSPFGLAVSSTDLHLSSSPLHHSPGGGHSVGTPRGSPSHTPCESPRVASPDYVSCVTADVTVRLPQRRGPDPSSPGGCSPSVDVEVSGTFVVNPQSDSSPASPTSEGSCLLVLPPSQLGSAHGGQGPGGGHPGGGVMDDGRRFVASPLPHPPASLRAPGETSKSHSLPGYYCRRPTSPPQTFRDAFATSYAVPVPMQASPQPATPHPSKAAVGRAVSESPAGRTTQKKGRRILGGLFRRRRKSGSPSSTSTSDTSSDGGGAASPRRRFFSRKSSRHKKGRASKESLEEGGFPPPPQVDTVALNVSAHRFRSQTTYLLTTDTGKVLKMSPTGSLGRETTAGHYYSTLVDGGVHSPATTLSALRPTGVSASHDSLVESAYGSINSSLRSSAHGGDRSSSTDTLTRRERREVLKARVERLRERSRNIGGGSSSEEGDPGGSLSSQFGSENSLTQGDAGHRKTRSSRTERYIRRKSQELETLRVEKEKDRRNREAVQARILEIQKNQKARPPGLVFAPSASLHWGRQRDKPKHVISIPGTHVTPNPPEHPVLSPKEPSRQQYVVKKLSDVLDPSLAPFSYPQGGRSPLSPDGIWYPNGGPPERFIAPQFSSMRAPQRSLSYDNHINKAASVPPLGSTTPLGLGSRGLTPPAPPPRDRSSSYLSPYEIPTHRPMSYSFENLHRDPIEGHGGPNHSFRRVAPMPPARGEPRSKVAPCRRSLSEKQLNVPNGEDNPAGPGASGGYSSLPTRPALPRVYSNENSSRDFLPLRAPCCSPSPRSLGMVEPRGNPGLGGVAPSSPCSDYSSYVSDHSFQKVMSASQAHPHPPPPHNLRFSPEGEHVSPFMKKGVLATTDVSRPLRDPAFVGLTHTKRLGCLSPRVSPSRMPSMLEKTPAQPTRAHQQSVPLIPAAKKPHPPKRNSSQEFLKQRLDDPTQCQKFREFYLKERERLKECQSANFEEALQELERIYESLNLSAEETSSGIHGNGDNEETRSPTPDKTKDDLHLRQVNLSSRNPPDKTKGNIVTGSYLLVSPLLAPPSLTPGIPDPNIEKEPDIVNDDVTVRNVLMANAIKVVDPQPLFGIPVGPVTQGARSDYLNAAPPKVSRESSPARRTPIREPDIVLDDLAFRSLRKDGLPDRSASTKAVNTSNLDRVSGAPPVLSRSRSVPRSTSMDKAPPSSVPGSCGPEATPNRTPRQLKAKKGAGGFCDSFKDALTDGEARGRGTPFSLAPKGLEMEERAPSANDLPEALTQGRIRDGIIHAARFPAAEKRESEPSDEEGAPYDRPNPFKEIVEDVPVPPPPPVLRACGPPVVCESRAREGAQVSAVDIAQLDDLISSLTEFVPQGMRSASPKGLLSDGGGLPRPDTAHLDFEKAKANIQSAIRLSMVNVATTALPEGTPVSPSNNGEEIGDVSSASPKIHQGSPSPVDPGGDKRKRRLEYEKQRLQTLAKKKQVPIARGEPGAKKKEEDQGERKKKEEEEGERKKKFARKTPRLQGEEARLRVAGEAATNSKGVGEGAHALKLIGNPNSGDKSPRNAVLSVAQRNQLNLKEKESSSGETTRPPLLKNAPKDPAPVEIRTMVQERRAVPGGERKSPAPQASLSGTPAPLMKSIRGAVLTSGVVGDSAPDNAEQEKRERIQRYKEQRRKQMAARYGAKEASSSEDDALHPSSLGSAYGRRRRRPRSGSGLPGSAPEDKTSQGSEPLSDNCKKETEGSLEPSGDAIHRPGSPAHCLTTVVSDNHLCNNNVPAVSQDDAPACPPVKDPSSEPATPRATHGEARVDSADSTLSGSEGRPGGRRRGSGEERDKSYKRKSHLNRASTSEEAVYPPAPISSHLSDSSEEVPRRRRRRNPQLSDSTNTSSPTTTPPDATPRGTPLGSSLSAVTTSDGQAGTLPPITPSVLSRGISHPTGGATSAPATLDHRYKADKSDGGGTPLIRGPTQKQTLKKPNIPQVFRPRDPNTPLGVVLDHTRPSPTHAMEKPPLAPEGSAGTRPFKSSLKKTPEALSCFLAPKRERRVGSESPATDPLKPREAPTGDSVLLECERYLKENKEPRTGHPHSEGTRALSPPTPSGPTGAPSSDKGAVSDSGQKNWGGGPEDTGDKIPRRLVFQDQVRGESPPSSHPGLAPGPPYNIHGNMKDDEGGGKMEEAPPDSGFELRSFPVTRRRSYSAKEDIEKSLTPPSGQGILKKSSCPTHAGWGRVGSGSFDAASLDGGLDPRPILKKKSSVEEDPPLGPQDPRKKSILKKKSLTDDELDWDRPRSILKGARSREDLVEHRRDASGGISPVPILKRGSRETPVDFDGGGELRPILKRRDTTDGIRPLILKPGGADHQGGAPGDKGDPILLRRDSAPIPSHGILKRRPTSPSLDALQSAGPQGSMVERPLSVAERVAGMEAMQNAGPESPQGAKPKARSRPSSGERPITPILPDRETRRNTWTPSSPSSGVPIPDGDTFRCPEAVNPLFSPCTSRVSQKAAFFSKLEQEHNVTPPLSPLVPSISKKDRGMRFATQPITDGEVSKATQLLDSSTEHEAQENGVESEVEVLTYSVGARVAMWSKKLQEHETKPSRPLDPGAKRKRARFMTQPVTMAEVASAAALNAQDSQSLSVTTPCSRAVSQEAAPFLKLSAESLSSISRRMSAHDLALEDSAAAPTAFGYGETVKGILKTEATTPRDRSKESPRSILRPDSRKSSLSEGEHPPRGILKAESPMSSTKGSPEHESRGLRSVLKKDSSIEDSRGIKSILKPESQSLDPEISSDSSSETVIQTVNHSLVEAFGTPSTSNLLPTSEGEYLARRASMTQQVLQEAVKQALPMMTKDNLAEALRQIEPIVRDKAPVDLTDWTRCLTKDEVISSIRERSLKKGGEEEGSGVLQPLCSAAERRVESLTRSSAASVERKFEHTANGLPRSPRRDDRAIDILGADEAQDDDETDSDIDECKASIKQTIKSLTVLGQTEESKFSRERVTLRQKSGQLKMASHKDRWTLNDFSSCRTATNSSPVCGSPPSRSSSSTSSTSSPVESRKAKLFSPTDFALSTPEVVYLPQPLRASASAATISSSSETSSFEKEVVDGLVPSSSIGSSINARLVSLQKNGDEGWKSRVLKDEDLLSPKKIRAKAPRPTSLLERVTQLESSSQQWKGRVTQTDATKFTVAHKMASASSVPSLSATGSSSSAEEKSRSCYRGPGTGGAVTGPTGLLQSPASERRKRSPLPKVFKSKTGGCLPDLLAKEATAQDQVKPFPRSVSITSPAADPGEEEAAIVAIPRPDDDSFNAFFVSSTVSRPIERGLDLEEYDASAFDHIASHSSRLAVKRRSIRAARTKASSTNPLKSLAQREDVRTEYTQVTLGIGERELRRMKVEELSKSSSLAMEALAGLASKENFSAVALKRVENNPIVREMSPHSDLMLIHVKGRRHPQVRLVEPRCQSVNQGDDFLLITPHELFHYKGPFANVIERAVASEMALYILQTKDMGVTSAIKVTDIEENSPTAKKERFWSKLGGSCESKGLPPGSPDSDDHIEAALIASNKVFEVQGHSMVPMEGAWGQSPKYELLSSDKVLVFDFGSELYIWTGKRASFEEKKQGTLLVKELWKEDFDYSDCDVNPTCPPLNLEEVTPMKGVRPHWGICGKITENVETILFKEKFLDWPDTAQQIRIKEVRSEVGQKCDPVCDLEPSDVNSMISSRPLDPDLILEMSHLGRGVVYYDEEERRLHTISTNDFKVWHISENEKKQLLGATASHFYSGETYVVRWYYHVTATGRTLKGTPSRHNVTGRSRVAYFFWQGRTSSVSDKGVSALMTVELDEERGPHVRVTMGAEPPAFLNLFEGSLVIHAGKRDLNTEGSVTEPTVAARLFVARGEFSNEAHLIEVDLSSHQLRSRGCLILANLHAGKVHLWVGSKVATTSKEVGLSAARRLCESPAEAMGWRGTRRKTGNSFSIELQEEPEGRESKDFLSLLGLSHPDSRLTYFSLLKKVGVPFDWTIRGWKLEAKADAFHPSELCSSYRAVDRVCAFPLWQQELYSADQPAIFLVDAGLKAYIWQGWFPEGGTEDDGALVTGSAYLRFTFARRAALQTALHYVRKKEEMIKNSVFKNGSFTIADCPTLLSPKLVVAGMESLEFTNLFPIWTPHEEVTQIQAKEGRWTLGQEYCVRDVLEQLSREKYSLKELQMVPLPDGVDPLRLERYLSDRDFQETLGVSRNEFLSLPSWKQLQLKKKGNLF